MLADQFDLYSGDWCAGFFGSEQLASPLVLYARAQLKHKVLSPITQHDVRWNGVYRMLRRMQELFAAMAIALRLMSRNAGRSVFITEGGCRVRVVCPKPRPRSQTSNEQGGGKGVRSVPTPVTEMWDLLRLYVNPQLLEVSTRTLYVINDTYQDLQRSNVPTALATLAEQRRRADDRDPFNCFVALPRAYRSAFVELRAGLAMAEAEARRSLCHSEAADDDLPESVLEAREAAMSAITGFLGRMNTELNARAEAVPQLTKNHVDMCMALSQQGLMTRNPLRVHRPLRSESPAALYDRAVRRVRKLINQLASADPALDASLIVEAALCAPRTETAARVTFGCVSKYDAPTAAATVPERLQPATREMNIGAAFRNHLPPPAAKNSQVAMEVWASKLCTSAEAVQKLRVCDPAMTELVDRLASMLGTSVDDERAFSTVRLELGLLSHATLQKTLERRVLCRRNGAMLDNVCVAMVDRAQQARAAKRNLNGQLRDQRGNTTGDT